MKAWYSLAHGTKAWYSINTTHIIEEVGFQLRVVHYRNEGALLQNQNSKRKFVLNHIASFLWNQDFLTVHSISLFRGLFRSMCVFFRCHSLAEGAGLKRQGGWNQMGQEDVKGELAVWRWIPLSAKRYEPQRDRTCHRCPRCKSAGRHAWWRKREPKVARSRDSTLWSVKVSKR